MYGFRLMVFGLAVWGLGYLIGRDDEKHGRSLGRRMVQNVGLDPDSGRIGDRVEGQRLVIELVTDDGFRRWASGRKPEDIADAVLGEASVGVGDGAGTGSGAGAERSSA